MNETMGLLMIGAMYENGGNTTHRLLDGHPQMYVYPFESQLGTRHVNDYLSSLFPVKYRWPKFALESSPQDDYADIIDEECKVRARTPEVSKFRHVRFDLSDDERRERFVSYANEARRSRATNVMAFFKATFDAWGNCRRSGEERFFVGYSPIVVVDAATILAEVAGSHFLHIVRNPWSAYADTKKRAVPLSLGHYMLAWATNQYYALMFRDRFPDRFHLVRIEDVMADPMRTLGEFCEKLGLRRSASLSQPSWNGEALTEVYPWGTIRVPTPEANLATAKELSADEIEGVRRRAAHYLDALGYETVFSQLTG